MSTRLEMPVGAPADVSEMEYCAALQQTGKFLRPDGTLEAADIRLLLLSRHGIKVSDDVVEEFLMHELAGCQIQTVTYYELVEKPLVQRARQSLKRRGDEFDDDGDDQEELEEQQVEVEEVVPMDMVQQLALLLLPHFAGIEESHRLDKMHHLRKAMGRMQYEDSDAEDDSSHSSLGGDDHHDDNRFKDAEGNPIKIALQQILEQAELEEGVVLTMDVLEQILAAFGERWPDDVLIDMLRACRAPGSVELSKFDYNCLTRALTADTKLYDTDWHDKASTFYEDALSLPGDGPLERVFTAPMVDYTADTYGNLMWTALSWFNFAVIFIAYVFATVGVGGDLTKFDCETAPMTPVGCAVANSILSWLEIFVRLTIVGAPYVIVTSLGNTAYVQGISKFWAIPLLLMGIAVVVFFPIMAYFYVWDFVVLGTWKDPAFYSMYMVSLILGAALILVQLSQLLRIFEPFRSCPKVQEVFSLDAQKRERAVKCSAHHKVERIIGNAIRCHDGLVLEGRAEDLEDKLNASRAISGLKGNASQQVMLRYHLQSTEVRPAGGVIWTWWRLVNGKLARKHGVWLFPRLVSGNLLHWFTIMVLIIIWIDVGRWINGNFDFIRNDLFDDGFDPFSWLMLGKEKLLTIWTAGAWAGIGMSLSIALVYIPSGVSTTLRFRCGLIGSLRDKDFLQYRTSQDQVTMLFGSSMWATFILATLIWFIVSAVVLACMLFQVFIDALIGLLALIAGFAVTMALKTILLILFRSQWYAAFYRKQPAPANVLNILLECWHLSLASGFVIGRLVKNLIVTIVYIGRIDVPFLSTDVAKLFGVANMDTYYIAFRKDLLAHDAHRHPFIERIAYLYLMKLRHGENFGTTAGAAWRILFTLAFMPWMRKFRRHCSPVKRNRKLRNSSKGKTSALEAEVMAQALEIEVLKAEVEHLREQARTREQRSGKNLSRGGSHRGLSSRMLSGTTRRNLNGGDDGRDDMPPIRET